MSGVAREGARSLHTLTKPEGERHLYPLSDAVHTALYLVLEAISKIPWAAARYATRSRRLREKTCSLYRSGYTYARFLPAFSRSRSSQSLARMVCLRWLLVLALSIARDASAQSILLGTSQTSGALVGYGISQKGTTVTVEPVGQIVASGKVGHLFGNFLGGADKELLQVRKIRNDTFAFIATKPDGTRATRRVRLSQDVGDLFYLLTAFDTNGNGIHGIAIIDVSEHHYRWHIIEDPLSSSMRVERPFRLGFHGERIDWVSSPNGEVEFVALRQTLNTRRTRALLRNANTEVTRVFRSLWESPSGLLIPVRLQAGSKRDPGVALYAPAKKEILLFDDKGGFEVFALPGQRCAGYQAVTNLSRSGAVSTIEVCSDGSYLVVERDEERRGQPTQESIISSGTLPEALENLRRGDATVVQETIGEISIPIAAPGSSGEEVIQPITQPGKPSPPATSTPKPQPTATAAPPDTPSNTPAPTPTVTPPSRFPMVGGATLLKDINDTITGNDSAYTKALVPLANGNLVFVAMNPEFGEEVWVTNGTLEGTQVLDSVNTMSSSYPVSGIGLSINPAGTRVYYACFSERIGKGVCVTDGTPQGTRAIPGALVTRTNARACDNGAFVTGSFGIHGESLVHTDGASDLSLITAVTNLSSSSAFSGDHFTCGADLLYFSTTNASLGTELWVSDGSTSGTKLVHDVYPGNSSGYLAALGTINRKLLFRGANNTYTGTELWMYDPDAANCDSFDASTATCQTPTSGVGKIGILKDIFAGQATHGLAVASATTANNKIYFQAVDASNNSELWVTDGTFSGTQKVYDYPGTGFAPTIGTTYSSGTSSRIYFTGTRGASAGNFGVEPHMLTLSNPGNCATTYGADFVATTDGTGCIGMIRDMNPAGNSSTTFYGANANGFFFESSGGVAGSYFWNNSPSQPTIFSSVAGGAGARAIPSGLIFITWGAAPAPYVGGNREPWFSNGQTSAVLKEINSTTGSIGTNNSSSPSIGLGNQRFFTAWNDTRAGELWVTDGTTAGTALVKDIYPGMAYSSPATPVVMNGALYFTALDATHGRELWAYYPNATDCSAFDPTSASAINCDTDNPAVAPGKIGVVKNIAAGTASSSPGNLTVISSRLYFSANDGVNGVEPWISDGTTAGTTMLQNVRTNGSSAVGAFAEANGVVVFQATNDSGQSDLYSFIPGPQADNAACIATRGSGYAKANAAGCFARLYDFTNSAPGISIMGSTNDLSKVFFQAGEAATGVELWVTDGTSNGTLLVKDIFPGTLSGFSTEVGGTPGAVGSSSFAFTALDSYAANGVANQQVWISDGTPSGTYALSSSEAGFNARALAVHSASNEIYFLSGTAASGMELWLSDGTITGTRMVKDLCPGACSGAASGQELGVTFGISLLSDGRVMYRGTSGISGGEPVVSDGTASGTYIAEIVPGSTSSSPLYFWNLPNGKIIVYANNNTNGHEPWILTPQ